MLRSVTIRVIFVLLGACTASQASAQTSGGPGPFSGLFGRPRQQAQSLNLGGSLFGVFQETIVPSDQKLALLATDPQFRTNGAFGGGSGSLNYSYSRTAENASFSFGGNGTAALFSVNPRSPQLGFGLNTGIATKLTRKIDFRASASTTYSPYAGTDPLALTGPNAPTPNAGVVAFVDNINGVGTLGITGALSKRSSIYTDLSWNRVFYLDSGSSDSWTLSGRAGYSYRIHRTLGFHAGWGESVTKYTDPRGNSGLPRRSHGPDIGLDFGDAATFALTRRTTVSFAASATSAYFGDRTQYALTGNASIMHSLSRSWTTSAGYNRSFGFTALFVQPALTDSVSGSIGGSITRRTSWTTNVAWTSGTLGFNGSGRYGSHSATSVVQVGIARAMSAYAQYSYYAYDVPPGSTTVNILSTYARQAISVGLTTSVPIFNKVRTRS